MRVHVRRYWRPRLPHFNRLKSSTSSQAERLGTLSFRLDELNEELEQFHCKITNLETLLQQTLKSHERSTSWNQESRQAARDPDYWIG